MKSKAIYWSDNEWLKKKLEKPGIEPGAFHMQSERATTALHPLDELIVNS